MMTTLFIITLAFAVVGVPVSYKLGRQRGVRLEQQSRWFGLSELDDLTPREALALAAEASVNRYGRRPEWSVELQDAITGSKFSITNASLPELMKTQMQHYAAQRTLKQLEKGT